MEAKSGQSEYEQVREDLKRLQEDVAKLTKSIAEGQRNNISHLRDEIRRESLEAFDQVRQRGDEALDRAREASSRAVENVEHKIEERPFLSIVLMFLAGLLVGRLLDR
ncbi:hypothetical protein KUV44_06960 [Marinobacter daepoensis]|uniref:Membrane-anchored ribosome-binding protein, inhibits growth in stationary phase, ElaB/YqjD/DUF883 family n=1 Tax=Marinobacter daepoensis TaxID=262077 RepID=A0ABS3BGN6_9GAMM|nr:hypothetical protein [Marinobacter daepoensis]MBN7771008.1 hypothetical protein [Marinobacter daepoensis]MBY6033354.1 hypothetical protein [Marinobacter daepoensis]MBY6078870.1 hypothetical protein [Marinobacter daepoensis]